jgi:class 3 adenylate cyclase
MLSEKAQNDLYQRFVNKKVLKSLHENFSFEGFQSKIDNTKCYSSVAYIDIYGFSNKIMNYSTEQVRDYLSEYYSYILKYIKAYNGQIEKIMGDGIIVVFSKIFGEIKTDRKSSDNCFLCCKECVESLYSTEFEVKAAIGNGSLFFCKTGVEQIYEEYSCIGHPLTIAYRLENIAEKNQILLMANTDLSARVKNSAELLSAWEQKETITFLKGIKESKVHIVQY